MSVTVGWVAITGVLLTMIAPSTDAVPAAPTEKLDGNLQTISRVHVRSGERASLDEARQRSMQVEEGRIRVVIAASSGDAAATAGDAQHLGAQVEVVKGGMMQALVPPGSLRRLADHDSVASIALPLPWRPAAVEGEGVGFMNGTVWQAHGATGAGMKVAIIDLGFAGLTVAQATGDLPPIPSGRKKDFCDGNFDTATDHGTAVAEIVHEVAPDAELHLICFGQSPLEFDNAVDYAIDTGVHVINHSIAWYNSSRGDGSGGQFTPDWEAARARQAGILWVNAAGNEAQTHWHGTFSNPAGSGFHRFAAGDEYNDTLDTIGTGETICAYLKWDRWSTPSLQNYDVSLYRLSSGTYTEVSPGNHASGGPTELVCHVNSGTAAKFAVRIFQHPTSFAPPRVDLFVPGSRMQYRTGSSIVEPASSPSVVAAGALCWATGGLEPYSSVGPTISGLTKPDLAAPDSVSGSTYGSFTSCGSTTSGFAGTSAAAPHVAGAAALIKQLHPTYGPATLQSFLERRALDLGLGGKDNIYGSGRMWIRPFTDVPPGDYGYASIQTLALSGITAGCASVESTGEIRYCPSNFVTRAEMAPFLLKAMGLGPCTTCATPTFADVPRTHWAYGWVEQLVRQGITAGCATSPRRYCPTSDVTRAQMAPFLMKAAGLGPCGSCTTQTFADVPKTHWAWRWIEQLVREGVTAGCGTSPRRYCPEKDVTRRDMAIFIVNTFDLT